MEMNESEVRQARRVASSTGYRVHKSRDRSEHLDNFGELMLCDAYTNMVVLGVRYDATPDEVINFCREHAQE